MGYDLESLKSEGGIKYFSWNMFGWPRVLTLAIAYGWEPKGTELDLEDWDGSYLCNGWQWVTEEDALNLANSLELALKKSEDLDADIKRNTSEKLVAMENEFLGHWKRSTKGLPIEFGIYPFNDSGVKERILAFIKFCRQGAFKIS